MIQQTLQSTLFPAGLDDFVAEDNVVRAVDVFVEALDMVGLGFCGVAPHATGRPAYHPSVLLKLYIYGHLDRVQSSRRLERDAEGEIVIVAEDGVDIRRPLDQLGETLRS